MLIGHHQQWQYLSNLAKNDRMPHALLFSGVAGVGKKTVALELIKLLNCQNSQIDKRPCQICRSCQDIEKKQYPDLTIIEPLKKEIQIAQIRDLRWRLSLRPYFSSLKAAIIDQAHLMNEEAQSCLLKTLEEPRGNALLILITEHPQALMKTILSRVQQLSFYSIVSSLIKNYLLSQGATEKAAGDIVLFARGRPGRAIDFLLNPKKLQFLHQRLQEIVKISSLDYAGRFQYAKKLSETPEQLNEVLEIWLEYCRGVLTACLKPEVKQTSLTKLKKIVQSIDKTIFLLSNTNVSPRLALETLMLEF